jgi:hypothetical protein
MGYHFSPGWVRRIFMSLCVLVLGSNFMIATPGCASSGTDVQTLQSVQIQKGVTTEQDLIKQLGQPQMTTTEADGTTILQWTGVQTNTDTGAAVGDALIPGYGFFGNGTHTQSSTLSATINTAGIVTDYTITNTNNSRALYN